MYRKLEPLEACFMTFMVAGGIFGSLLPKYLLFERILAYVMAFGGAIALLIAFAVYQDAVGKGRDSGK